LDYQYPISPDWKTEEIIDVINFYQSVEKAYEKGVHREDLMATYRRFKEIVPSKAEEKQIDREFEETSGYSTFRVIKKAKEADGNVIIKG
jgi:uncharacterized protein YktA (UPF0223 family)